MSLDVNINRVTNQKSKSERYARITFRGTRRETKAVSCEDNELILNQEVCLPVSTPLKSENNESLEIEILIKNKIFSDRHVGSYQLVLNEVISEGSIRIEDNLKDEDDNVSDSIIHFDLSYLMPKETVSKKEEIGLGHTNPGLDISNEDADLKNGAIDDNETKAVIPKESSRQKIKIPHKQIPKYINWQVTVCVIQAQDLTGVNIDPCVIVKLKDDEKSTSTKEKTNDPLFDETFSFELNDIKDRFLDNILHFNVVTGKTVVNSGDPIGDFKLDLRTVFDHPGHCYLGKWAVLLEKETQEIKGYLRLDIIVCFKGSITKNPSLRKDVNIDDNLLQPEGSPAARTVSALVVRIFKAEGLQCLDKNLLSTIKNVFGRKTEDKINSCIEVSFAGSKIKGDVVEDSLNPVFNQDFVFEEFFPPMFRRIKIKLLDGDGDGVFGTHYIDLDDISLIGKDEDSEEGFLPTFGPSWVHLYGGTKDEVKDKDFEDMEDGFLEGSVYRGRIMISVFCKDVDANSKKEARCQTFNPERIKDKAEYPDEEFQLFATVFEASMIERKVTDKPMFFEISIGESLTWNAEEGPCNPVCDGNECNASYSINSLPTKPATNSRKYYHLSFDQKKPCIHLVYQSQDTRRRLFDQIAIHNIADTLECHIEDLHEITKMSIEEYSMLFKDVLLELEQSCRKFISSHRHQPQRVGWNDLDRHRRDMRVQEVEEVCKLSKKILEDCDQDFESRKQLDPYFFELGNVLKKLKNLRKEPQDGFPDIFLWMKNENKAIGYARIEARSVIYSKLNDEQNNNAGRLQTIFLREPGRPGMKERTLAKVDILIWLGIKKHTSSIFNLAPKGYILHESTKKMCVKCSKDGNRFPEHLIYKEKHKAVLRAHIYQARNLFMGDESGLSDPFARIIYSNYVCDTKTVKWTQNPTWDQMLKLPDIVFWGNLEEIVVNPPLVVIEFYDQDEDNDTDYIGKAIAKPIMKLAQDKYEKPLFPPVLQWFPIYFQGRRAGDILAAFELLHVSDTKVEIPSDPEPMITKSGVLTPVPMDIRPIMKRHRIEVMFWGLREIKKAKMFNVNRPKVIIDCSYEATLLDGSKQRAIHSETCRNAVKKPNFDNPIIMFDLDLPENEIFIPPLSIRVIDCRSFNRYVLAGTHIIHSLSDFFREPPMVEGVVTVTDGKPQASNGKKKGGVRFSDDSSDKASSKRKKKKRKKKKSTIKSETMYSKSQTIVQDWWTRYFSSCEIAEGMDDEDSGSGLFSSSSKSTASISTFEVYHHELEDVKEFQGFSDYIQSFPLLRGKNIANEEDEDTSTQYAGTFKGKINIWKYPLPKFLEDNPPKGSQKLRPSGAIGLLVRVYCIKAINLSPLDSSGKADPYLVVSLGNKEENDSDNYVPNSTSPEFGKVFELTGELPFDNALTVKVYDWNIILSDDVIGVTTIDIENRYFSKHRPTCGLQKNYSIHGYSAWRDREKPSQILARLCSELDLMEPSYPEAGVCVVDGIRFKTKGDIETASGKSIPSNEPAALKALHNFHKISNGYPLVPEHIETRTLYHPDKPGIPQGQLHLWVDIFPTSGQSPGAPVDIKLRKPVEYELRVIIHNTRDVIRTELNMLTGEKSSDIYVKAWLDGNVDDTQKTDVHFSSTDGSGSFNWRFVFGFLYNQAEEKIISKKKESLFALDETEQKYPCQLHLQIWDADFISSDDIIGEIVMDLNRVPVPARMSSLCGSGMLKPNHSHISMLANGTVRGFWPVTAEQELNGESKTVIVGKLEAELELVTKSVAETAPVGKERDEPCGLPKPDRPQENMGRFMNPLKVVKLILWNHKVFIVKYSVLVLIVIAFFLFFYSIPGYSVKKMFNI